MATLWRTMLTQTPVVNKVVLAMVIATGTLHTTPSSVVLLSNLISGRGLQKLDSAFFSLGSVCYRDIAL